MDLSVIIPTLHRVETAMLLAGRIKGLLPALQIEVIVVVTEASEQPVPPEFVRYVVDAGRGVYAAYSTGLRCASGEYVWLMGEDDYPLDAASGISNILRERDVDLLVAPVIFSSGRLYGPTRTLLVLHFLNWCQQGVIYRRRDLLRHRFYRRLTVQADQYVNILLRSDPAVKRKFLTEPICVFGVNGVSGRVRDAGYRSLRLALAHRTLSCGAFFAFRLLTMIEPLVKRIVKIR